MKIACLMYAVWICSPPAVQAAVAASGSDERGRAEASAASPTAGAQSHGSVSPARGAVPQGAISKGGNTAAAVRPAAPQRAVGPLARSNADRLHSLLRPARPAAKPPHRLVAGMSRAETTGTGLSRMPGLSGASPARLAGSQIPGRALRNSNAPTPGALVGGPHPTGLGALGGPATGRAASGGALFGRAALGRTATANRAALDGAQMRRRF
jgi:hypothetical protein